VLDQSLTNFGLEHLLVLFMFGVSLLLVAIAFERALAMGFLRVSLKAAQKVIVAARTGTLRQAREDCDAVPKPVRGVLIVALDRALGTVRGNPHRAIGREKKRVQGALKARTWILATAGALMPFVGLFGTVIGVMASFEAIGESGQGGFAVVSVGISQALIATAVGIAVALEGVFLFNLLQNTAAGQLRELGLLTDELLELIEADREEADEGRTAK
jgi:biopolymer transport protein ExbB/TolQ